MLEADGFQPLDHVPIQFNHALGHRLIGFDDQRRGGRGDHKVGIFQRFKLVPNRLVQPRAGIDGHHGCRAALDQGGVHPVAVQVERDIVGAAAGADDQRPFAGPAGAAVEAFSVQDVALKIFQPGDIRDHGIGAHPVGEDEVAGMDDAHGSITTRELHRPALGSAVPGGMGEVRIGPAIDFHGIGIEFKPVPQHVLGDVFRPGRRERHIGQVVEVDGVVQRERVVALAPAVADARPVLDHQRIDPQLVQPCGDRQAGLGGADHQHRRLPIRIGGGFAAGVSPVVAAEIARICRAGWPIFADFFLVPRQRLQRGREVPRFPGAIRIGRQPQQPGAAAVLRGEAEQRLVTIDAQTGDLTRRFTVGGQMEALRGGAALFLRQALGDGGVAFHRGVMPGEGQHIAPLAIGMQ